MVGGRRRGSGSSVGEGGDGSPATPSCWALILLLGCSARCVALDYKGALTNSILYFEAQRSGALPQQQRAAWRGDSGLRDGQNEGIDLVGGYYDAGDHVKYGLPMAFAITMLSWSVIEYEKDFLKSGELEHALDAIKWGTDYLIKAHPEPNVLWGEVGDGMSDHYCWQRAEEMTTPRNAFKIDSSNPGSDLAGETAAAMAAASIIFRSRNKGYADSLLWHAEKLFTFADTYKGKYDNSIPVAKKYYQSASGFDDELLWAALWLYKANGGRNYLDYAMNNAASLGGTQWAVKEMSWDIKYAGVQILASKILFQGQEPGYTWALQQYQSKAHYFLCACLQKNKGDNVQMTPGKLLYTREWNNLQYVTTSSFLLMLYSDLLSSANQQLQCPDGQLSPSEIFSFAQSQVDYILGKNPRGMSYMVGMGNNYPKQVHHRGASIVSIKQSSNFVSCQEGFEKWYDSTNGNPNPIVGAVVGGPDQNDGFSDERDNYEQTEPTLYTNSPLVGVLARLAVKNQH